jgi:hypothetical protein
VTHRRRRLVPLDSFSYFVGTRDLETLPSYMFSSEFGQLRSLGPAPDPNADGVSSGLIIGGGRGVEAADYLVHSFRNRD